MIDVDVEQLIPLTKARTHPALRNVRTGKPAHASSIFRYALQGARATDGSKIRLECVKLPSGLATSVEAIGRFVQKLTDPDAPTPSPRSKTRDRQLTENESRLASLGMV